jgi:dihydroneopterin aldolase
MTSQVALEGLEFFAYHGFYEEERKMGNKYQVDVIVDTDLWEAGQKDKLSTTLNYETLYQIVQVTMQQPAKLLEHVAYQIIEEVYKHFPNIIAVEVAVAKYNPPVGGVCKWARVKLKK